MNLRAFFNKNYRQYSITTMLAVLFIVKTSAQSSPSYKIPNEIKFANITFQLNDVAKYLMNQEIETLVKNKELKDKYIQKLGMIMPIIDPVLKNNAIPLDFRTLSLYNKYQSSVSTTSVLDYSIWWCFDEKKAMDVDLVIDKNVDERKHLVLATAAAASNIKRSQVLYSNWGTTLFAQLASRSVINNLDLTKKWRSNFIALDVPAYNALLQFLAFKFVIEHDFNSNMNLQPTVIYEYPYGEGKSLNLIAADLKVEPLQLLANNAWLMVNKVPEGDTKILVEVPSSRLSEIKRLAEFSRNQGGISEELGFPMLKEAQNFAKGRGGIFYKINDKKGIQADMCDSYVTLAYKADISIKKFLTYNDLTEKDITNVGQVYYLEEKDKKALIPLHITKPNETFWDIAQTYGVKLKSILEFNREDKVVRLETGRVIYLQATRPKDKGIEIVEPKVQPVQEEIIADLIENSEPTKEEPAEEEIVEKSRSYADSVFMQRMNVVASHDKDGGLKEFAAQNQPQQESHYNTENIAETPTENNKEVFHKVQKGETLYKIAMEYGISIEQIYALNNIATGNIEEGENIIIRSY